MLCGREKFIKEQLDRRLGRNKAASELESQPPKLDDMYAIPAALRVSLSFQTLAAHLRNAWTGQF